MQIEKLDHSALHEEVEQDKNLANHKREVSRGRSKGRKLKPFNEDEDPIRRTSKKGQDEEFSQDEYEGSQGRTMRDYDMEGSVSKERIPKLESKFRLNSLKSPYD